MLYFGLTYVGGNLRDTNRLFEPGTALLHGGVSVLVSPLRFCYPTPLFSRMMSSLRSLWCVSAFAEANCVSGNHVVCVRSTNADNMLPKLQIGSYWEEKTHPEDKWA